MPNSNNIQTLTLGPGQTGWIPINATILGVGQSVGGDVEVQSTCIDLTPVPSKCYSLTWEMSGHNDTNPKPLNDAYFSKIIIGNLTYAIPDSTCFYEQTDLHDGGAFPLFDWTNRNIPPGILTAACINQNTDDGGSIGFRVSGNLPIPQVEITNPTGQSIGKQLLYMYMYADDGACDCHP